MNKLSVFILAVLTLVMNGCNISSEATRNSTVQQTNIVLSSSNYRVLGQVEGRSRQLYILAIGGMSGKSMAQSALSDMYNEAFKMARGRSVAVINTSVYYKTSYFLLAWMRTAYAKGTVIEFVNPESDTPCAQESKLPEVKETANVNANSVVKSGKANKQEMPPVETGQIGKIKYTKGSPVKLQCAVLKDGTRVYGSSKKTTGFNRGDLEHPYIIYNIEKPNGKTVSVPDEYVKSISDIEISWDEFDKLMKE